MNVNIRKGGQPVYYIVKDETGYAVLFTLNGYIYLMDAGGFRGGYDDSTLNKLAQKAKQWKVQTVVYESNFGDGMFGKIFSPVLLKAHQCGLEEYRSTGLKEARIADTLEPVLGAHRFIISEAVVIQDYQTARDTDSKHDVKYSLFYQWTRVTRDRGALAHDDRLDALAIGVDFLKEAMELNSMEGESNITEEFLAKHMEKLEVGFLDHRSSASGDMTIHWEDDGDSNSYIQW